MKQYLDLLQDVMENGQDADNRTGIYARKVFGRQARYDLSQGFPLVTTKKTFLKGIIYIIFKTIVRIRRGKRKISLIIIS